MLRKIQQKRFSYAKVLVPSQTNPLLANDSLFQKHSLIKTTSELAPDSLSLTILSSLMIDQPPAKQGLSLFSSPNLEKEFSEFLSERWHHYQSKFISNGAYTDSVGNATVREGVVQYLYDRDQLAVEAKNVFVLSGLNNAFYYFSMAMISGADEAIMLPRPFNNEYVAISKSTGANVQMYDALGDGLGFQVSNLVDSIESAKKDGKKPKVLVVVNPGYPSSVLLSESEIKLIIEIAAQENMVLLVDESFQEIALDSSEFVSFKKVLASCSNGNLRESVQLISLHCLTHTITPSGFGGLFAELTNIPDEVYMQFNKAYSISLCSNTIGQIALDLHVRRDRYLDMLSDQIKFLFQEDREFNKEFLSRNFENLKDILSPVKSVDLIDHNNTFYSFAKLKGENGDCVSVACSVHHMYIDTYIC